MPRHSRGPSKLSPAERKAKHGTPGLGRPKHSRNIRTIAAYRAGAALAREYAPEAVNTLARVMRGQTGTKSSPTPESVRVAACNSILDRAYGRPAQTVVFDVIEALEIVYRSPEEILEEIKRRQLGPVLEIAARSVDTTDVVDSGGNDDNNGS